MIRQLQEPRRYSCEDACSEGKKNTNVKNRMICVLQCRECKICRMLEKEFSCGRQHVKEQRVTTPSQNDEQVPAVPDEVLVTRAQAGDDSAFEQLITRHKKTLYGAIYHMTSNHEDASDLLQDTLMRAYRALPKFRADAKFSTWIYRIALNVTINFLRQARNRTRKLSLDDLDMDAAEMLMFDDITGGNTKKNPEEREQELRELQVILNQAIQELSEKHRTVVVMHDIQGKTHMEIAQIINVPEGTVKTRLFHAHKLLQKKLGRHHRAGNL